MVVLLPVTSLVQLIAPTRCAAAWMSIYMLAFRRDAARSLVSGIWRPIRAPLVSRHQRRAAGLRRDLLSHSQPWSAGRMTTKDRKQLVHTKDTKTSRHEKMLFGVFRVRSCVAWSVAPRSWRRRAAAGHEAAARPDRRADVSRQPRQTAQAGGVANGARVAVGLSSTRQRDGGSGDRQPDLGIDLARRVRRGRRPARILRLLDKHRIAASSSSGGQPSAPPEMIPSISRAGARDRRARLDSRASAVGERRRRGTGHAEPRDRDIDQGDRQETGRLPRARRGSSASGR